MQKKIKNLKFTCEICQKEMPKTSKYYHIQRYHSDPTAEKAAPIFQKSYFEPEFTVVLIPFEDEVKGYLVNGKNLIPVRLLQVVN